jgi:hypothetical protein
LGHFGTKTRPRGRARTRPTASLRVSTRKSVTTRVEKNDRNFGRASERFVSERPQCGEREMARTVGPATERVTACYGDHGRLGAGHVQRRVTAPGHGGHGTRHGIHGASQSDHGDEERPAGPESAAASATGAAAFTIPFQGLARGRKSPPPQPPPLIGVESARDAARDATSQVSLAERCGRSSESCDVTSTRTGAKCILLLAGWLPTPASAQPLMASRLWSAEPRVCRSPASWEPWGGCDARDLRLRPHGATTPSTECRFHRLKSTAMTARCCAPLRSSVTLTRVLRRIRHDDARVPLTDD